MKKKLTVLLVLLSSLCALSQESTLSQILASKDDTVKVNKLIAYAKTVMGSDSKKAREQLTAAYQLSVKLNYAAGSGNALVNLGSLNRQAGKYEECNQNLYQAMAFFRKASDDRGISNCQLGLGSVCELTGKRDSAIIYYMAAVKIIEAKGYLVEQVKVFYNLGMIYNNLKDYNRAIEYEKKALQTAKQLKDTFLISSAYGGLSLPLRNAKRYGEAYAMASEALALAKARQNKLALSQAYDMYSQAAAKVEKFNEAIVAGKTAIKYAEELDDLHTFLTASISLAETYYDKGVYNEVITVLTKALEKCKKHNNILYGDDIYAHLANAYSKLGNYKAALEASEELYFYKDSIFNIRKNDIVEEYEIKYQTAQKEKAISEKQLQLAQKDLQLQRSRQMIYSTIAVLAIAFLIIGLLYFNFRNRKKAHRQELQSMQQEKEIQLLHAAMEGEEKERSRIAKDLHDGVAGMLAAAKMHLNSLSIRNRELEETKEFQQAVKLLDDSSHEVRITSHNLMPEILMQHGLEEALRRFCNNISNEKVLKIEYDAFGEIGRFSLGFELTVYRIVQEFLNNIVRHAKATTALVQLSVQNNFLSVTIEDNGIGFDMKGNPSTGTGLHNLKRRIEAMNGTLEIDAQPDQGVSAFIGIDVTNYKLELWKESDLA